VPPQEEKSYIEELKKGLYSRMAPDVRTRRKLRYSEEGTMMQSDWLHPKETDDTPVELNTAEQFNRNENKMSFFTKLFIGSLLFCILAVGLGAYLFFNGANLISANNIDIQISGPVSVAGGTPITFDITAVNKNNVDLRLVDMSVNFPAGTTDASDSTKVLTNYTKLLGDMPAGATAHESVSAIIFGEENLQKEITVNLTYSVKGSSSVFTKTQTYDVLINSSPVNVTADSFKEITSGQQFDMKVNVKSNSAQTLKNVLLKAEYPFGFTFVSASSQPLSDNATWRIGDMAPGSSRTITIHGKLSGEDSDVRAFHFFVGAASSNNRESIATQYLAIEQDVTLQKPFISLSVAVDSDTAIGDHIGQFGQVEHVTITWFNNLPDAVSDVKIDAKLTGSAYDKSTVTPDQGFFNSGTDDIVWNQQTNSELASVAAGSSGTVSFNITPVDHGTSGNPINNPTIAITANVSGSRAQGGAVPQSLTSATTKNIRVASNVRLSGRLVRTVGPFTNTGPIPPKADQATTYTVIWDIGNTSNAVSNAEVTATLPAYVKWLGVISPTTEDIIYDKKTGLLTWNVGSVSANTTGTSQLREAAFQISFTPSITQVGQSPTLVGKASLTATDSYTSAPLTSDQDILTTRFSTDPGYRGGDEGVTK